MPKESAMTNIGTAAHYISATLIQRLLATVLLSSALMATAVAQGSVLDSSTPPGLAPGAPAGSYALSDLDNINLFNGNLSFRLPLLKMGGRGSAGYTMMLKFERKWIVHNQFIELFGTFSVPSDAWWQFAPNYSPGQMDIRQSGVAHGCISLIGVPDTYYASTLTRLTFTAPDGTEFELRDQLTGGKPLTNTWTPCDGTAPVYPQRGSVFVTADGTSATFISDTPLHDSASPSGHGLISGVSGFLTLRDGTRYRIDSNRVSWVRDRNGNKVSFTYMGPFGPVTGVTDSLNRQVTIAYRDLQGNPPYDQITYKGFGGATRTIRVHYTPLSQALRADHSPQQALSVAQLFPELNGSDPFMIYDPTIVSSVELPDGRRYRFYYNHYSELTRAELPTGGAIEYDYTPGSGVVGTEIIRRVIARRVYTNGGTGSAFDGQTTYHYNINLTANMTTVVVNQLNPSGALLSREKHYFYGTIWGSFGLIGTSYAFWREGREYQTERLDTNDPNNPEGGAVLQRVSRTWQQRAPVSWWPLPTSGCTSQDCAPSNDPRIVETVTTLADANLVSKQTFGYDQYNNQTDAYEYDFGVGAPGPLIRRTHTPYLTTNGSQGNANYATDNNIHIRSLPIQQLVYDASGNLRSHTDFVYDYYDAYPLVDCPGIVQHDGGFHTGYGKRGNLTGVIHHNPGGSPSEIHLHNQYDIAGNLVKAIDGRGFETDFYFDDRFGIPDEEAQSNSGAPELAGGVTYAFPTKVTNELGHTAYTQYDYHLGKLVNSEDANGVVGSIAYNDALDRPTQGIQARYKVGVGVPDERRQTTFTYDDTNRVITTTGDRDVFNDNILTATSFYDGLGRTHRSAAHEGSTWTITDTQFDALGRVSRVSNPYRSTDPGFASPPTELWTTTDYDALGRAIRVTTPDGAHVDTVYSGAQVTVTDQAGKQRRTVTDALGRLTKVTEDPGGLNYETTYLYDVLGNLRKVTQGSQTRWFAYDSLSRLIRVKNPEQNTNVSLPAHTDPVTGGSGWSMAYSHDANGNLTQRIDARGVVTNYSYDTLNRSTGIDYVNISQTRSVEMVYDGAANGKGRLHYKRTKEGGVNSTETKIDGYDAIGRPLNKQQSFWRGSDWGTPYVVQHDYDLAGAVKTLTYPSGHAVSYIYDQAGRLNSFTGNLGDGVNRNYSTGIQYDAAGSMKREQFGTTIPLYHRRHYNNRGQLFDIRLGTDPNPVYDSDDLSAWQNAAGSWNRGALSLYYSTLNGCHVYGNGGTGNNGNVLRMDHHVPVDDAVSNFVASIDRYDYDPLNRLKSVTELSYTKGASGEDIYQGVFRQEFLYDRWGNRTIDQANTTGGVNEKAYTVDAATNRLTSVDGVAMSYDAAGNQTNEGSGERKYDGENRLVEAKNNAGVVVSWYVYDAEGRRVVRTVGSQGTWQIYGCGGELLAEYAVGADPSVPQKEYGYRSGQLLVTWDGSETGDRRLQWLVQDHLGSTRMAVDRSGSLGGIRRHDFAPFGEELFAGVGIRSASNGYSGDSVRQKFVGYERDSETGLDFAQARYHLSMAGRFTSPDPLFESAMSANPQTWNRYSYALNNPLYYVDPTGLLWIATDDENNPYRWVDECPEGGTCYSSVAANVGGDVHIYGSRDARDITISIANEYGMVAFTGLAMHPDAAFQSAAAQQVTEEHFVSVDTGVAIFNATKYYEGLHPDDDEIVITHGSIETGGTGTNPITGRPAHPAGHRNGTNIDIRYMDANGRPIRNRDAVDRADTQRTMDIADAFDRVGWGATITGDQARFGLRAVSQATEQAHRNHMHIQRAWPVRPAQVQRRGR
jgi:RHS repeat-associated protein